MMQAVSEDSHINDITLVSEDVQLHAAHRVILSSTGTLFDNCTKMNYRTNPTNLLKNMKKNAVKNPMKIKVDQDCICYEFSSGSFSQVILPALEAMTVGLKDTRGETTVEVISNTIRTDLINIADSTLLRLNISYKDHEVCEAVVHVYLHKHTMMVQGSSIIAGMPVWNFYASTYLTPMLDANMLAKNSMICASNEAITRKIGLMFNCNKCSAPLKGGKGLSCKLCCKSFHVSCTDNKHKKKAVTQKELSWVCLRCRASSPTSSSQPSLQASSPKASTSSLSSGFDALLSEAGDVEALGYNLSSLSLSEASSNSADSWEQYPPSEGSIPQSVGSLTGQSVVSLISANPAPASPQRRDLEDAIYSCDKCSFDVTKTEDLVIHKEQSHKKATREPIFACEWCQFNSNTDEDLMKHKYLNHKPKLDSAKEATNTCNKCNFVSMDTKELKTHIENSHNNMSYNCQKCDMTFSTEAQFKDHIELFHTCVHGIPSECDMCNKKANANLPKPIKPSPVMEQATDQNTVNIDNAFLAAFDSNFSCES